MELDHAKIDDAVLALLQLGLHDGYRAWKGFDWDSLGRLVLDQTDPFFGSLAVQIRIRLSIVGAIASRWCTSNRPCIASPASRRENAAAVMELTSWETTIQPSRAANCNTSRSGLLSRLNCRKRTNSIVGSRRNTVCTIALFRSLSARNRGRFMALPGWQLD
jgi:hypothetical protein